MQLGKEQEPEQEQDQEQEQEQVQEPEQEQEQEQEQEPEQEPQEEQERHYRVVTKGNFMCTHFGKLYKQLGIPHQTPEKNMILLLLDLCKPNKIN